MQRLGKNTLIYQGVCSEAVKRAVMALRRDMDAVFTDSKEACLGIRLVTKTQERECFCIRRTGEELEIGAGDELGFIYGLYHISKTLLGIADFWFWNDQEIEKKEAVEIEPDYYWQSQPFRVKLRGWFVNDEVLISAFDIDGDKDKPWEMVFETLLRLGGNMVIPGTDQNAARYRRLASDMGLMISHHHAEPLGAEMFLRAYPELEPSYKEQEEKFQKLWQDGIEKQKDLKVVWNLGFRGQGDCPFWEADPEYQTDEARGALISSLIRRQYEMVKERLPEAVCCTNLYGETMELYQDGHLDLPSEVIKIWADNGYGKMVSRRQENHNPRIPALPEEGADGCHGIYYHVSFYDLQASNHITMLQNRPEFIKSELKKALKCGAGYYWMINCSNVKPHTYMLDLTARLWRDGDMDIKDHMLSYVRTYYGAKGEAAVADCIRAYFDCPPMFGKEEDEHAGEEFPNHGTRILVSALMKDPKKPADALRWAKDGETLEEQITWFLELCTKAKDDYQAYLEQCERTALALEGRKRELFLDSILLQAKIHLHSYKGAFYTAGGLLAALAGEDQRAFYLCGKGKEEYLLGDRAMRQREHGKWLNFYQNECLTDIKQSAWVISGLMSYLRNRGDGPHFYEWQREFLYSREDRKIMLLLNKENHLTDEEIYVLMKKRWDD